MSEFTVEVANGRLYAIGEAESLGSELSPWGCDVERRLDQYVNQGLEFTDAELFRLDCDSSSLVHQLEEDVATLD